MEELESRKTHNALRYWEPYDWQEDLCNADAENAQILAMCANRVGKSYTGARRLAIHATGLYPDWWTGHRWEEPIKCWAAGVSAESTRDILQNELLGTPEDPSQLGTGAIPKDCIGERTRKAQVPNAVATVMVRHHTNGVFDGWSKIDFKAFEQGEKKFMGTSQHEIWLDEQPPDGLFTQCITRTANTGGTVTMTFTPEDGVTPVVNQFMKFRKPGMKLIQATWDDAPHLTESVKEQLLSVYGEHERDMRSKGIPVFGSGPVFPVAEETIAVDPFDVPDYWPGIIGIDFGWDHPTAAVWLRLDPDSNTVYITDCYRQRISTAAIHAAAINSRDGNFPIAWPHDGMVHDKGSGVSLADQYRQLGCNMLFTHFTNPLAPGETGKGNNKVEPGINAMLQAMEQGRFKVFKTCNEWFQEFRMYHRENGIIHALDDDLMSATRYAFQSTRYADKPQGEGRSGTGYNRGFDSDLSYGHLRLV